MKKPLSEEKVIEIQSLYHDKKLNIMQIQEETGHSTSLIDKYIKLERVRPRIPEVPKDPKDDSSKEPPKQTEDETKRVKLEGVPQEPVPAAISPYPEIPEPEDWLKQFLDGYRLKPVFVQAQCARVKRRNQLPTPADLMLFMKEGDSGQKNPFMVRDIVEDYDYAVDEYMKMRDAQMNMPFIRRQGISIRGQQPADPSSGGIPLRNQPHDPQYDGNYGRPQQYDQYNRPQPDGYDQYGRPFFYSERGIPLNPPQQQQPMNVPTLQQQLLNFVEMDKLIHGTQQATPNPDMIRMGEELAELRRERREDKEREIMQMREQLQRDHQDKQQLQIAVRAMEEELRAAEMNLQFEKSNKRTTEQDVRMREIDTKFNIDNKKLDEGGKTREAIANAVTTGFSQVGQAIFRTAQELGTEETRPMMGHTDSKHMWQGDCPFCKTPITAPLSADVVTCPGCGKQLGVSEASPKEPPKIESDGNRPSTEYVPPEQPRISECPFCNSQLTIPAGLEIIECPQCHKRLKVVPPEEVPPEIPEEEVPEKVPEEFSKETPPEYIPPRKKYIPKEVPEKVPEEIPSEVPKEIPPEKQPKYEPAPPEISQTLDIPVTPEVKKIADGFGTAIKKTEELKNEKVEEKKPVPNKPFTKDGYTLFKTITKSGTPFYYFGKASKAGEPCFEIPEGRELGVNSKTGLPILKKKKE